MLKHLMRRLAASRVARITRRADRLRDGGYPAEAAHLYRKSAQLAVKRPDLYVQVGNMLKDSGQYGEAVRAYASAFNGFVDLFDGDNTAWIDEQLADVCLQLGHAFKLAGARAYAVHFYRRSNALKPMPDFAHEVSIASLTEHGISEHSHDLPMPNLVEWGSASPIFVEGHLPVMIENPDILENFQCVCWSREAIVIDVVEESGATHVMCRFCGSVTEEGLAGMGAPCNLGWVPTTEVYHRDVADLLAAWPIDFRLKRVGLVGAYVVDQEENSLYSIETISLTSEGISVGFERCSFDVVIVWQTDRKLGDMRRVIDQTHQLLRPNGLHILGYAPLSAVSLMANMAASAVKKITSPNPKLVTNKSDHSEGAVALKAGRQGANKKDTQWVRPQAFISDYALRSLLEPLKRDAWIIPDRYSRTRSHNFIAMKKTGVMEVGIMSGIGDAVWSFVIQKAVRKKYGATALRFHVNDSGDGRRKRSNNMLARFSFVDDMVTAPFQIHTEKAIDPKTGHLNYMPSGPVRVNDPHYSFDYFLVVNTFLEHGWDYGKICEHLDLDKSDIDFDFFQEYKEEDKDLTALEKITHYIGDSYVIFYYGAEVDNTVGGLNRDEVWKPEDWNRLGRMINEEYGLKVVVIGAPYDASYANKVLGANNDLFYFNTIGQLDITATLSLIQRCRFMIAFPAGVGIVGPYMRVPTTIFWRPQYMSYHVMHERAGFEPDFATDWVPPAVVSVGDYYPAWYGTDTPESVFDVIKSRGWAKLRISKQIGV